VGLFPFQGDRDLGTRSFERFGQAMAAGGNMFETEIYANLFKGIVLIELDRVGMFRPLELIQPSLKEKESEREKEESQRDEQKKQGNCIPAWQSKTCPRRGENAERALAPDERRRRLQSFLEALNLLWGGGRTARMLADLSPKFLAYARLRVKHPVFLEALSARYEDGQYVLDLIPLVNALEKFASYREHVIFGMEPGIFGNEDEIRQALQPYGPVLTVHNALKKAQEDVSALWSGSSL
jgi:CRISPR-associated protein Cst2